MNNLRTKLRMTLLRISILSIFILLDLTACRKNEISVIENPTIDWEVTQHRKLFDTTEMTTWKNMIDFAFINDSIYFLYGRNLSTGIYKTYLIYPDSALDITELFNGFILDICISNESVYYIQNTGDSLELFHYDSKIFKSSVLLDDLIELSASDTSHFSKLHFIKPEIGIGLINGSSGLRNSFYITIDHGESWDLAYIDPSITDWPFFKDFFILPNNQEICLIANRGRLYISENGGMSWDLYFSVDFRISSIYFINKNIGYLVSENKIYRTIDGGEVVDLIFEFDKYISKIQVNSNEVYFLSQRVIYYSDNDFIDYRPMKVENPKPESFDTFVMNFEIRKNIGLMVDNLGNVYTKKKKE